MALERGKAIGNVEDVFFNFDNNFVKGMYVATIVKKYYISLADIKDVNDMVIIQELKRVRDLSKGTFKEKNVIKGGDVIYKKVFTYKGQELGFVNDVFFDLETGSIEALELSDGIIQDLISGRKLIPMIGNIFIGEEGIFVNKDALEEMIENKKYEKFFRRSDLNC